MWETLTLPSFQMGEASLWPHTLGFLTVFIFLQMTDCHKHCVSGLHIVYVRAKSREVTVTTDLSSGPRSRQCLQCVFAAHAAKGHRVDLDHPWDPIIANFWGSGSFVTFSSGLIPNVESCSCFMAQPRNYVVCFVFVVLAQ